MKKSMAVILAAVMALSLTACGGSGSADTAENHSAEASGTGAADSGKTEMVVAMGADIDTLHPSDYSTTVELTVLNQV